MMRKQFKDIDIYAGIPPSISRFALFIQKKTSKAWSTSTSQLVFLLICVVRIQ